MQNMPTRRSRKERGSVLVLTLLLLVVLTSLGFVILTLSLTEHGMASNGIWAEGAFAAAEAGINVGVNQLSPNTSASVQPVPSTAIGGSYAYRSGRRTDAGPQPQQFVNSRTEPGYNIAIGTGYNPSGYVFNTYQINATGSGPRNATREIEVRAEYGPVAQ
jgi:hypothetical protein